MGIWLGGHREVVCKLRVNSEKLAARMKRRCV